MKASTILLYLSMAAAAMADVNLPAIISDHMVLHKAADTPVWGTASPGEEVTVELAGQTEKSIADDEGNWQVELDLAESAPGPFEMTVTGQNHRVVSDVLVGEVWVSSGQSNMGFLLANAMDAGEEIARSDLPMIRQFRVSPYVSLPEPRESCDGEWVVCGPETAGDFSAVGYFFAKTLNQELGVPVGLIHNAWGGTPVEAWMSYEALEKDPQLKAGGDKARADAASYVPKKEAYDKAFTQWLKDTGREDHPPEDAAAYAGTDVSTAEWKAIDMPGTIFGEGGLPECGVIWVRGELTLTAAMVNGTIPIRIGSMQAFPTLYWNGEKIGHETHESYPGEGYQYRYYLRGDKLKEGKNTLAIRFYGPYGNDERVNIHCDFAPFDGGLKAKVESTLPPLSEQEAASLPQALPNPLRGQDVATYLFNGMVSPLLRYGITGVIWYQGESNVSRADQYRTAFPLMIEDWREQWGQGDFPFYYCQLANIGNKPSEPGRSSWAVLREAQTETLELPNTGMAVLTDLGEAKDIHPRNKEDVGERLALVALAKTYGQDVVYSGPMFESMEVDGDKAVLSFTHTDGGLVAEPLSETYVLSSLTGTTQPLEPNSPDSELEGFAICGEDHNWVWADARIEGDQVVVWSESVKEPVAVRYNWADNPSGNLYNASGLPAIAFRTDDEPVATEGKHY